MGRDVKSQTVEALKHIPYEKVAEAINKTHLDGALRSIPKITFADNSTGDELHGLYALCKTKKEHVPFRRYVRWHGRRKAISLLRLVEVTKEICLDLEKIAGVMMRDRNKIPITAILTHELIHTVQAQNGYPRGHGKAGKHSIKVKANGYKDWSRDLTVHAGSEMRLIATLEKAD